MEKLVVHYNGFNCWYFNRERNIVYLIEIGDSMYIGSTENARARFVSHINTLLEGNHQNKKMQNAFDKAKSFTIYLLEKCCSKDEAFVKEKEYIRSLLPNLNNTLYFKEWPLNLSTRKELLITLSKIIMRAMDGANMRLKDIEKKLGLKKMWLRDMSNGVIEMNQEQFSELLKILRLTVVMKDNEFYIRFIKDNKYLA